MNNIRFESKSPKLTELSKQYNQQINELEKLFNKSTNIYIDYANVRPWSTKLGWHVDLKRLYDFLKCFKNIKSISLYMGTLEGNLESETIIKSAINTGYRVITKPVKIMKIFMDVSGISLQDSTVLKNFIRPSLLLKFKLETIEYLNSKLAELNLQGILYIEDRKCNFDVEIGRDMMLDLERNEVEEFVLWSGDSDFADPLRQIIDSKRTASVFATARRISREISDLGNRGLFIYDIQKIKKFICWKKEMGE